MIGYLMCWMSWTCMRCLRTNGRVLFWEQKPMKEKRGDFLVVVFGKNLAGMSKFNSKLLAGLRYSRTEGFKKIDND